MTCNISTDFNSVITNTILQPDHSHKKTLVYEKNYQLTKHSFAVTMLHKYG